MIPEMLRNALSVMVPNLGTHRWSHWRVAVKEHLLTPVVKLARWGALASGCSELSTPQRLTSVSRFALSQSEAPELGEAFSVFLAAKLDLDLGLIDDTCTDHRGRLILPSLARSRASAIVAAAVAVRGVQKAAATAAVRLRLCSRKFARNGPLTTHFPAGPSPAPRCGSAPSAATSRARKANCP